MNRHLTNATAVAFDEKFQCDLIADRIKMICGENPATADGKEPARRVAYIEAQRPGHGSRDKAVQTSRHRPPRVGRTAGNIARTDYEIYTALLQRCEQLRNRFWRMTEIAVHHDAAVVARVPYAFENSRAQTSRTIPHN